MDTQNNLSRLSHINMLHNPAAPGWYVPACSILNQRVLQSCVPKTFTMNKKCYSIALLALLYSKSKSFTFRPIGKAKYGTENVFGLGYLGILRNCFYLLTLDIQNVFIELQGLKTEKCMNSITWFSHSIIFFANNTNIVTINKGKYFISQFYRKFFSFYSG